MSLVNVNTALTEALTASTKELKSLRADLIAANTAKRDIENRLDKAEQVAYVAAECMAKLTGNSVKVIIESHQLNLKV